MIKNPFRPRNRYARQEARKEWLGRLDRIAGDLNVLLVVVAVGLATLDVTFLVTQNVIGKAVASIPVTRVVVADEPPAAPQK